MTTYKKIHYIWLGGGKKNKIFYRCYDSWKKFLPDWDIIEWNESNLDISKYRYVQQAYDRGKYAFAVDVLRFDIINKYQGIYFDTDVEIISSLNSLINAYDAFTGFENKFFINPGLVLFSKSSNKFCTDMLLNYTMNNFYENGSENLKTICEYSTEYFLKYGLKQNSTIETINEMTIFPKEYFCPFDYLMRGEIVPGKTKTIHHYAGSWLSPSIKFKKMIKKVIIKIFGENFIEALKKRKR